MFVRKGPASTSCLAVRLRLGAGGRPAFDEDTASSVRDEDRLALSSAGDHSAAASFAGAPSRVGWDDRSAAWAVVTGRRHL